MKTTTNPIIGFLNKIFTNSNADPEVRFFLHNDDGLEGYGVARSLSEIVGVDPNKAIEIMMDTHKHGTGLIGKYPREKALDYKKRLGERGITTTITS
jgi:ATP-dependent Clp protease adapter protein ClpS